MNTTSKETARSAATPANRPVTPASIEPRDDKELISLLADASGRFACATGQFYELCALFESIAALTQKWSPQNGLAQLGTRLADDFAASFGADRDRFSMEVERYAP